MNTSKAISTVKQELRLQEWSAQIEAQQSSGLTVQKWCEENGLSTKTYYYRLRRLREAAIKKTQMGTLQPTTSQPELVQYTPPTGYVAEPTPQSIVIRTSSTTVEIPMNTNPEVVAAAVSFLKQS